ncbi:MAG: hypothetical protein NC337_14770 [Roseburia sp.]|nr:hypothetical protein [Roseburia sp.]
MLSKLMKYEWRGMRTPLLIMLCVLAGTTLLTCGIILTIRPQFDDVLVGFSIITTMFSFLLYYFGLIGCIIGITVIIAVRFYRTCYTDQGYLTHTLPVSAVQLLVAKTIIAVLSYLLVLAGVAATLVIIIFVATSHFLNIGDFGYTVRYALSQIFSGMNEVMLDTWGMSMGGYMLWALLMGMVECVAGIFKLFGCISLGQLYAKHRILGAILAYFALNVVQNTIAYISILPTFAHLVTAAEYGNELTMMSAFGPSAVFTLITSVVLAVVMYFVNLHMMTKRLNLE